MATKKTFVAKHGLTVGNTATGGDFTMPSSDGSASQVIVTDGSGNLSWSTQSGGLSDITGESIKDFSDVYSSMTPTDGQALVYDTTNGWQAETLSGGGGGTNPGEGPNPIFTSSTSDPTTSTNPSSNGAIWFNSSANTFYVCIDNTSGSNIWKGGSVASVQEAWNIQGENYGFHVGGNPNNRLINKYAFASSTSGSSHGTLASSSAGTFCCTDTKDFGFAGGYPSQPYAIYVYKFPFASATNSAQHTIFSTGDGKGNAGAFSTLEYGYRVGGTFSPPAPVTGGSSDVDKFQFSSMSAAVNVGDMTTQFYGGASCQTSEYGYRAGGYGTGPYGPTQRAIEKWSFASEGTATSHGALYWTYNRYCSGCSSSTHGYAQGGGPPYKNTIQKFPFASTTGSDDVGDMIASLRYTSSSSSTTHGYITGGTTGNAPGRRNYIQRYPFASDTNATDIGDLSSTYYFGGGTQY